MYFVGFKVICGPRKMVEVKFLNAWIGSFIQKNRLSRRGFMKYYIPICGWLYKYCKSKPTKAMQRSASKLCKRRHATCYAYGNTQGLPKKGASNVLLGHSQYILWAILFFPRHPTRKKISHLEFYGLFFSSDKAHKPLSGSVAHRIYWGWPYKNNSQHTLWHYHIL